MQQSVEMRQYPVATFSEQQAAEEARNTLAQANFVAEHLTIKPQFRQPTVEETNAARSARGGAIAGTLFGCMGGLILGYLSAYGDIASEYANFDPIRHLVGLSLAGSGIGAAGGGLLAALTGFNVAKPDAAANPAFGQGYVIFLEGTVDEVGRAKEVLQANGVDIESGTDLG